MAGEIPLPPHIEKLIAERIEQGVADQIARWAKEQPLAKIDEAERPSWVSALALGIAELSDQGSGVRRIPAPELAARDAARARMEELLDESRQSGTQPQYRLHFPVYLNDQLINPNFVVDGKVQKTEIIWGGVPNEAMEPVNDVARPIYEAFLRSIGQAQPREMGKTTVTPRGLTIVKGAPEIMVQQMTTAEGPLGPSAQPPTTELAVMHTQPGSPVARRRQAAGMG